MKVFAFMKALGIPALSEVVTREAIYYEPVDNSYETSLFQLICWLMSDMARTDKHRHLDMQFMMILIPRVMQLKMKKILRYIWVPRLVLKSILRRTRSSKGPIQLYSHTLIHPKESFDDESLRKWKEQLLGSVDVSQVEEVQEPDVKILNLTIVSVGRPDIVLEIPDSGNPKGLWAIKKGHDCEEVTETQDFGKVFIRKVPVMLRSSYCTLFQNSKKDLTELGECPYNQGGYFIINESEKVMITQEKMSTNHVYVFKKRQPNKDAYVGEVRSMTKSKNRPPSMMVVRMLATSTVKGGEGDIHLNEQRVHVTNFIPSSYLRSFREDNRHDRRENQCLTLGFWCIIPTTWGKRCKKQFLMTKDVYNCMMIPPVSQKSTLFGYGGVHHHLGPKRPRVYSDLSPEEKDRYNVDIRATNILLQGLPKDIYTLINHYTDEKDIWDNVKMLLEGSELTKEDQVSQLNIKMTMSRMQLNSKFVNNMLPEWGRFVTAKNKMMLECFSQPTMDPLALMSNVSNQQRYSPSSLTSSSTHVPQHLADNAHLESSLSLTENLIENLTNTLALLTQSYKTFLPQTNNQLRTLSNTWNQATIQDGRVVVQNVQGQQNREQLLFLAGGQDNAIDDDVDEQHVQDLALNVDNVFQGDDCDAFDSDVQDHDHYQNAVCAHHEEHATHDNVQLNHDVDSHADYTSDSNMIPYDQYVKDNAVLVVQSNVSSIPNDAFMIIYNDMYEPHAQSASNTSWNTVVENLLTAKLATYKEHVEVYERRAKFELTEREQKINE
uniref:DNA-directed RNA polymerase n=1 Tax=Tanacetum cinerariifolium TaxID=118510 RepID=A0A6L2LBK9_TANCI|nr:RNA polymerase II second largest subunit [Tanacetum cinerariifolium]